MGSAPQGAGPMRSTKIGHDSRPAVACASAVSSTLSSSGYLDLVLAKC